MLIIAENASETAALSAMVALAETLDGVAHITGVSHENAHAHVFWGVDDVRQLCRRYGVKMRPSEMQLLLASTADSMVDEGCPAMWAALEREFRVANNLPHDADFDYRRDDVLDIETDLPEN